MRFFKKYLKKLDIALKTNFSSPLFCLNWILSQFLMNSVQHFYIKNNKRDFQVLAN